MSIASNSRPSDGDGLVEGVDQLKTRDSLHTIDNLYSVRSKQAAILAKKDIKMDAERIHMG